MAASKSQLRCHYVLTQEEKMVCSQSCAGDEEKAHLLAAGDACRDRERLAV